MTQQPTQRPLTPTLDKVINPEDLRALGDHELSALTDELRAELIDAVSHTGGHLGAGLGVVELTGSALAERVYHYIFNHGCE